MCEEKNPEFYFAFWIRFSIESDSKIHINKDLKLSKVFNLNFIQVKTTVLLLNYII